MFVRATAITRDLTQDTAFVAGRKINPSDDKDGAAFEHDSGVADDYVTLTPEILAGYAAIDAQVLQLMANQKGVAVVRAGTADRIPPAAE